MSLRRLLPAVCLLVLVACSQEPAPPAPARIAEPIVQAAPSLALAATAEALLDTPILDSPTARQPPTPRAPTADTSSPNPISAPVSLEPVEPKPQTVQRIVISAIELDQQPLPVALDETRMPVVPDHEIGWYTRSAGPGQNENIVLWGHALRFRNAPDIPAPFGRLKELTPGTEILLYDEFETEHPYTITQQVWATPDQVQYILPTGTEQLTLVSCIGDQVLTPRGVDMTHRLITIAEPLLPQP